MAQAKLIAPITKERVKKKVAAYCRVSSRSAEQQNSYANQLEYYRKKITGTPDWELVDIFADEGISGTSAEKRPEFMRMIQMCELRQIEIVITKSISRFARNVKEALEHVRRLKHLGIAVIFEKEGINTMSLGDEMLLNTFSAIAQEESEAISQNLRNSITHRMELGEFVDGNAPYGYRLVNKALQVYEPEAAIVRSIFHMYLHGRGTEEIAKILTARGIPTKLGKPIWRATKVAKMLCNEKYIGDSCYQKSYRIPTVPFTQYKNRGQADMYYASNTHPAIIAREDFERVQEIMQKRALTKCQNYEKIVYPLTSHIRCVECGSSFRRKLVGSVTKWVCTKHQEDSATCKSFYYVEDRIYEGIVTIINKLRFCDEDILGVVINKLESASNQYKRSNKTARQLSEQIAELSAKLLMLDQLQSKGYLAPEIYHAQAREIRTQLAALKVERTDSFDSKIVKMLAEVRRLKDLLAEIVEPLEAFDESLYYEIVKEITINNRDEMTVTFIGDLKFTEVI